MKHIRLLFARLPRAIAIAFFCASIAACQTFNQAQFTAPADHLERMTERVRMIAISHGMADCLSTSVVNGVTTCYKTGDASFTFVGVRRAESLAVVDLSFRSAGVGGELFKKLESELTEDFRKTFGDGAVQRRERATFVPMERLAH